MIETEFLNELKRGKTKTILDSILISDVTDDSIIKSINNKYVKIFKFYDLNFVLQDGVKKREILDQYKRILNALDTNVSLSILMRNKRVDLTERVLFDETDNRFIELKKAANEAIRENVDKDNNTYVVDKYFVFDIKAPNIDVARSIFAMIDHLFNAEVENLEGAQLRELTKDEIYKLITLFYNENELEKNSNYLKYLTKNTMSDLGITFKEMIKPSNFIVHDKEIIISDKYYRGFYFYNNYKIVDTYALTKILSNDFPVWACIKIKKLPLPEAVQMAELEFGNASGEIYRIESELARQRLSKDLLPINAVQRKEEAVYINESLKKRDENLFDISFYMMVEANDIRTLNENTYKLQKKCALNGLNIKNAEYMQDNVFNSIMPNGVNQTPYVRTFDTESLCGLNIFNASDCIMKDGDYFGVNKLTNNPIVYDKMTGDNFNMIILGMAGKGKGFFAKFIELCGALKGKNKYTIILDPENEYRKLTESLGGVNIDITSGGKSHINLFDIDLSYGDNSISDKEDFILSVVAEMLHKPITSGQRTTISQAVSKIYEKWSETNKQEDIPTILDFANALREIVEKNDSYEDKEILKAVEYYSDKSHCTLFRGKSNIDLSNRLITFNLSKLGKDLKTLAMQVICDTIWLKICKNVKENVPTDLIIDELHLMFKSEETATWMAKYWKMLRKYKGCPIGITQNPEDVLSSEDGRKVIANTNMSILLSMYDKDRNTVKDILNLTNEEIKYIRNKKAGEGLLVIGTGKKLNNPITLPFKNRFEDKSNLIYRLINTSGDEEVKKEEKPIENETNY